MKSNQYPISDRNEPTDFPFQGEIRRADGQPLASLVVRLFDQGMRSEQRLVQSAAHPEHF